MGHTFWIVSPDVKKTIPMSSSERQSFRADAMEVVMYYVGAGEAIVISHGGKSILVDGGSGSGSNRNDKRGSALARRISQGSLQAIVASHPHRDHTNFHAILATAHPGLFPVAGAQYFDNATQAADSNWGRLQTWQPNLPFNRVPVHDDPDLDDQGRIPSFFADSDAFLLRASTGAKSVAARKYWSAFMLLRFREAWLLFTGDAHKGYEKKLLSRLKALNASTHLLKVTHHGSSSGTAKELLNSLDPKIAIASTARDSGHRLEKDVRERLPKWGVYTTYDRKRAHRKQDVIVRTDGKVRTVKGVTGVRFEVWRRDSTLM